MTTWTNEDVERWMNKIKRDELDYQDQVKIVRFISDQQVAYTTLNEIYERTKIRASEITKLLSKMTALGHDDFVDDRTLRAGMKFLSKEALDLYARYESENG